MHVHFHTWLRLLSVYITFQINVWSSQLTETIDARNSRRRKISTARKIPGRLPVYTKPVCIHIYARTYVEVRSRIKRRNAREEEETTACAPKVILWRPVVIYERFSRARVRLSAVHNFVACNKVAGCCFCGKTTGSLPLLLEPTLLYPLSLASSLRPPKPRADPRSALDARWPRFLNAAGLGQPALFTTSIGTSVVNPPRVYRFPSLPPALRAWKNRSLLLPLRGAAPHLRAHSRFKTTVVQTAFS